jgi:hypothetical protein
MLAPREELQDFISAVAKVCEGAEELAQGEVQ